MKKITLIFAAAAASLSLNAQVLYNNGTIITHPGQGFNGADASALMNGLTSYGFNNSASTYRMIAEDFTVTGNWSVDTVEFWGYQTGSSTTSTFTDLFFMIWDADPSGSANVVFGDTVNNVLASSSFSNIYRTTDTDLGTATTRPVMKLVAAPTNLNLTPGTYWIGWRCGGTLTSGPWVPPISSTTQTATGNGIQFTGGTWVAVTSGPNSDPQGFPFVLKGTTTSVPEIEGIASVNVYPNPVNEISQVSITLSNSTLTLNDIRFVVYDILGNEVARINEITSTTFDFHRGDLASGMYTYRFITRNNETLKTGKLTAQ